MKTSLKTHKNTRKKGNKYRHQNYGCFFTKKKLSIEAFWGGFTSKNLRQREQSRWRKNSHNSR